METKPIAIVGGGLWGSLLALRLQQTKPDLEFVLYENEESLADGVSHVVLQNEFSPEGFRWLSPFLEGKWSTHQVKFHESEKVIDSGVSLLTPKKLSKVVKDKLKGKIRPITDVETILKECSFIIDTRNNFYYPTQGFQKITELEIKLESYSSHLPVLCDGTISQWDGFRYLQTFPKGNGTVLVREIRHSADAKIMGEDYEEDILSSLNRSDAKVLKRSTWLYRIPSSSLIPWSEGRILRTAGINHDFTGSSVADAVRLIDKMVSTSFRRGELNEVVYNYRAERESRRKFFRIMSRFAMNASNPRAGITVMERLYKMPKSVRDKFFLGELDFMDFMRTLVKIKVLRPVPTFSRQ